jgi:hypothetical protein
MNKLFCSVLSIILCCLLSGCLSIISRSYTVEYQRGHFVYKPNRMHHLQQKCTRYDIDTRIDTNVFYEGMGLLIKFYDNGRFINFIGYPRIRYAAVKNIEQTIYEYPNELVNDLNQYTLGWYYVKGNQIHCSYFRYGLFGPIMERFRIQFDSNGKLIQHLSNDDIIGLNIRNREIELREVRIPQFNIHSTEANW